MVTNNQFFYVKTPFPVSPKGEKVYFNSFPRQLAGKVGKGVRIKNISLKGQNRNNLNCYMNCEEIHSYRDLSGPSW
jgi:hypothetical protein